jgi:hypothetical protein
MIAAPAEPNLPPVLSHACAARFAPYGSHPGARGSWRARLVRTEVAYRDRPSGRVVGVLRPAVDAEATMPWAMVVRARAVGGQCRVGLQLPERPNGRVGWVDGRYLRLTWSPWRIEVTRATRRAVLIRDGNPVRTFSVDIGTAATPTPRGLFAVLHATPSGGDPAYGPWVLALTAESNRLFAFAGGPGRIGLHGRGGGGAARSAGCVRFTNDAIRWIVARVGRANLPGTAVSIR